MNAERKALPGAPQRRNQENLAEQAIELDRQIKAAVKVARHSLTDLGGRLTRMKESRLWQFLPGDYRSWEAYARSVLGSGRHSSLYETLTAYSLTQGSNPIPPEDVNKMGVKRAALVARLNSEQRTPEIRQMAKMEPVMVVRNKVQALLNEALPADEQKPMLKLLAINLPEELVDEFEENMEVGIWLDGIRDGDNTRTMRAKVFHAMLIAFREYYAPELAAALKLMKAQAGANDSSAASVEEDVPEEEEGDEFPVDEEAHL